MPSASRTSESVRSVPSSRLTANQSQPPPPTEMKSPHWWSNQAWPVDLQRRAVEGQRARRRHRRARVVVRTAGRRRSRSSRRGRAGPAPSSPASARSRPEPVRDAGGGRLVGRQRGGQVVGPVASRPSSRPVVPQSPGATGRGPRARGRSRPARRSTPRGERSTCGPTSSRWAYMECDRRSRRSPRGARPTTSGRRRARRGR